MIKAELTGVKPADLGFDFEHWRPYQLETAERIINSPKNVIVLSAPTGFGKSCVVQIPARLSLSRQLILTRTKTLQTQYERDGIISLYGRDNYACNRNPKETAARGICRIGMPCHYFMDGCNYFDAKRETLQASEAVLNYAYFFLEANGPGAFTGYDFIVCDEGHCVPEELSKTFSIRIFFPDCRMLGLRVPKDKTVESLVNWARRNLTKARQTSFDKESSEYASVRMRASEFQNKLEMLSLIQHPEEWVVELADQAATVRPIWPDNLAKLNLWPHASKFILSSATINPSYTLSMLGLEPSAADVIEVPSTFPKEYRPIFINADVSLNHHASNETLQMWIQQIDRILCQCDGMKGLIHTGNYQLANMLLANSFYKERLVGHSSHTRQLTLERFRQMTGDQVLVSPSMTEGIDLPYDHCRFQIIAKIPFPNMTDKVWEARFAQNRDRASRIYQQATIDQIVQAAGRGMRAADDYCETWIIDGNIRRLLAYHTADFPKFFREAIRAT